MRSIKTVCGLFVAGVVFISGGIVSVSSWGIFSEKALSDVTPGSFTHVQGLVQDVAGRGLVVLGIIVACSLGASFLARALWTQFLGRDLNALTQGLRSASHDDFERELPIQRRDELGLLAQEFARYQETAKALHSVVHQYRVQAELARTAKARFLATVSHELRTPLHTIIGMVRMVMSSPVPTEQRSQLHMASDAAYALLKSINEMIDVSAVEHNEFQLEKAPFVMRDCVAEALTAVEGIVAGKSSIQLVCDIQPEVAVSYSGDGIRLKQALVHLLENAIKFTESGYVALSISNRPSGIPEVDTVLFEVRDTGIGIPHDRLSVIFDPFVLGDDSLTRMYAGSGLGLALVRHIAHTMGGDVSVESTLGEGTSFHLTVPIQRVESAVVFKRQPVGEKDASLADLTSVYAQSYAPEEGVGQQSESCQSATALDVLIADDTRTNRIILTEMLEGSGHRVTSVEDGLALLKAVEPMIKGVAEASHFDLVLTDIQMPYMDGVTATREIRALEQQMGGSARLPIVAVTAHTWLEGSEELSEAGLDALLTKPINPEQLHEVIQDLCIGIIEEAAERENAGVGVTGASEIETFAALVSEEWSVIETASHATSGAREEPLMVCDVLDVFEVYDRMGDSISRTILVLQAFQECYEELLTRTVAAHSAEEPKQLRFAAHALKGILLDVGSKIPAYVAASIESLAKEEQLSEVAPLVLELSEHVCLVARLVERVLSRMAVAELREEQVCAAQ